MIDHTVLLIPNLLGIKHSFFFSLPFRLAKSVYIVPQYNGMNDFGKTLAHTS